MALEDDLVALQQPADLGAGHRADGDGDDVEGAPLGQNHLQGEDHAGDGGIENRTDGTGRAAPQQDHPLAIVQAKEPGDIGTQGRAAHDDRRFRTGRTAAADGQAAGNQARKARSQAQPPTLARYGMDHFGHPVPGVLSQEVIEENGR